MDDFKKKDLMVKGKLSFDKGDYETAQLIFQEIIETDGHAVSAFFYLGSIFHVRGEISKAISAFQKVLNLDSSHTEAAIALSVLYNDIGKYDLAKDIFDKANANVKASKTFGGTVQDPHINKKFSFKHFEIAEMYLLYNRFDEALFEYNKAIGLDPDNLELRIKVAKVYAKKGFISKAQDELKQLINECPGFIPSRIALGVLYYGNGNIIEAQGQWQRALSIDPTHKEALMYLDLSKSATETTIDLR